MSPPDCRPAPKAHGDGALVARLNRALDGAVEAAHRVLPGWYHPYFLTEDLAFLSLAGIGFLFQAAFGHLVGWIHAAAISTTFVLYVAVYLRIKRRLTGVGARSFMQDSLVFVLPVHLGLSWALGQEMAAGTDALALSLLLAVGLMRIGCFLGGCCHGKPSRVGVLYGRHTLRDMGGSRPFACGAHLGVRVFPIQLVCSAFALAALALLWTRLGTLPRPDGSTLALAAIAYSVLRFVVEFFRGHRHRPMRLGLSEAQWVSLGLLAVACAALRLNA